MADSRSYRYNDKIYINTPKVGQHVQLVKTGEYYVIDEIQGSWITIKSKDGLRFYLPSYKIKTVFREVQ